MKKKTSNATVSYDPVAVSENTAINFTHVVAAGCTTVYGKIVKDGTEVGSVAYDSRGGYLNTSLKPFAALTEDEVRAVYEQVPACIGEILEEE